MGELNIIPLLIAIVASLGVGFFIGQILSKRKADGQEKQLKDREASLNQREATVKEKANIIIKDAKSQAESIKKEKIYEAKEKYLKLKILGV